MTDAPRRCYYEVLGLEDRKCEDDEIRRGYKRSALRCHPDRNHGNEAAAALEFKEVQNAYTVLIDPDERAWYDSHREAILRGDSDGTCAPDELNVFDYFAARCYDGFSDADPKSFFNVYRKVFETIVKEESEYNDKVTKQAPSFGDSTTPWTELGAFYNFWKYFITAKTFAWKDEHKLNEIPDRQYRREAERMNNKVRAAARKEYTSAVNQLAHHLYLRDPRVQAEKDREEKEKTDKLAEREKKDAEAAKRRREANKKIWEEAAELEEKEMAERVARGEDYDGAELEMLYEKQRQLEKATKKGDKKAMREAVGAHSVAGGPTMVVAGNFSSDDEEGGKDSAHQYKCNGCKKSFATDKTFNEHVKSGKHKTKFKQLEKQGVDVSTLLVVPPKAPNSDDDDDDEADNDKQTAPAATAATATSSKKEEASTKGAKAGKADEDDDDDRPAKGKHSKETATAKKGGKGGKARDDDADDEDRSAKAPPAKKGSKGGKDDDDEDRSAKSKPVQAPPPPKASKKGKKGHRHSDDEDEADEPASVKYQKSKVKAASKAVATAEDGSDESSEEEVVVTKNKFGALGKKKK